MLLVYFILSDFGFDSLAYGIAIVSNPLFISAFALANSKRRAIFQPKLKLDFLIPEW